MTRIIPACRTTVPVGFEANCTIAEAIGDPVVFSTSGDNVVERLTSNSYDSRLVIGVISEKLTPTTCIVVTMGILENIATGLSRGLPLWVSPTGSITTTRPLTGDLQVLGNAISPESVAINIEMRKVKLV